MDYFLLDENHSIVNFINCGNRMFLIFKVKINDFSGGIINISVGINGSNGDRITQLNSKTTRDTINLDSSNSFISLEIYKINLMPDNYSFNIYLTIDGNISDWIINAGEIKVVESDYYNSGVLPASNQGRLLMDYKYQVTSHL